jgi:putative ABC transport system permease protein
VKYLPLILSALWRRPIRTTLTALSVAIAFFLFGSLHGISAGIDAVIDEMSPSQLRVQSRTSALEPLPVSYLAEIERIPGVLRVSSLTNFGGYFRDSRNDLGVFALGGEHPLATFPSQTIISAQTASDWEHSRTGVIVGRTTATKYGWHLGDRIPLQSAQTPAAQIPGCST